MQILFFTRTWHGTGGLQQLSHDLWREIKKQYGADAELVCPRSSGIFSLMMFAVRALWIGIRSGRSVHIHLGDGSLCPLGAIITGITGAKVSVTVAGLDVIYNRRWYQWLLRQSLPYMDRICCISKATADEVHKRGISDDRIVIIPCGIDETHLASPSHNPLPITHNLLIIGRFIQRKGTVWFVDKVMPLLLKKKPDVHLTLLGDGPDRPLLQKLIRCNCLGDHITLLGAGDNAVREKAFADASLFVMPTIPVQGDMEGFGIVCIEASARGIPVVASRLDGVQDAVMENQTGSFFVPGNAEDCVRAMIDALDYPLDPQDVAAATKAHYDWSLLIDRYKTDVFR